MSTDQPIAARKRRPLLKAYLLTWAVVGIAALSYLVVLLVRPDLVAVHPWGATIGVPEGNEGARAMSRALAELQSMRTSLTQAQLDIAKLKTGLESQESLDKRIAERLSALELRLAAAGDSALTRLSESDAVPAAPATGETGRQAAAVDAAPEGSGTAPMAAQIINATTATARADKPPAAIETGSLAAADMASVASAPISFGPAVVKQAPQPEIAVRLSKGPSVDALRLSWSLMAERHGDALRKLQPRYVEGSPEDDNPYELLAGPVKSTSEAKRICKTMQTRGIPCEVGPFTGNAL